MTMETTELQQELKSIHEKLDFLTGQLKQQQQYQREMKELKDDLGIISKDMFNAAVTELEDVAPYFDTGDIVHLLKRLLRNVRNLNKMMEHLESAQDLFADLQPLGKQVFDEIMETMNELDRKGYFEFFSEGFKILDTIVTSFSVEDVRHLRENITTIILTIKNLTQPEMLSSVDNALSFFSKMDIDIDHEISMMELFRKMRDPEVKKGMAFMLEFVKSMAQNGKNINAIQNKED
ncbi:MAG TPA: DUF1641 domain-containing protein [Caldithrix abyssi]|uniref:DUF1641 domain-containing protein n=1 Tax=Caldithrix abyssi TaxID=187145 RepID=A0A7V5RP35_CALAY|nr:DUF1641 domain-containing protein [Caldithrix abyssi]